MPHVRLRLYCVQKRDRPTADSLVMKPVDLTNNIEIGLLRRLEWKITELVSIVPNKDDKNKMDDSKREKGK